MEDYKTLSIEVKDKVAWVRMNRPEAYNALNMELTEELYLALADLAMDENVRSVVLTGAGKAFSSGGDIKLFAENIDDPVRSNVMIKKLAARAHRVVSEIVRMPKPVIAAVNGVSAGGALGITLACDVIIAVEHAQFMVAYTGIGLTPDCATTYQLSRLIGVQKAKEILFFNKAISAKEAYDLGIVSRVLAADKFAAGVDEVSRQLARGPVRTYGRIKELIFRGLQETLETQMENERIAIGKSIQEKECKEGLTALMQKREPDFISAN